MNNFPSILLSNAVDQFASLPGIGRKTALRLVLHLLRQSDNDVQAFTAALTTLKSEAHYCRICHTISDEEVCPICRSHSRDKHTICVVENVQDVMSIENTGQYHGLYHVLGGVISPMDGVGPADLEIDSLIARIVPEEIREVILALPTTMEGDTTNFYIYRRLTAASSPNNLTASSPHHLITSSPNFPFLCLLVSGGNSQIVLVKSHRDMEIIGQTIDDAAGEAFDKCAKIMGLPYPGGPWIDRLAKEGNPEAFVFAKPNIPGYNYSFSGLKTSFLYFLRDHLAQNPNFIEENKADLCASLQKTIIDILILKLKRAAKDLKINEIAVAGGVSANSGLRDALIDLGKRHRWLVHIPPFSYTTDNAAMVCQAGYFKYLDGEFCPIDAAPYAKTKI